VPPTLLRSESRKSGVDGVEGKESGTDAKPRDHVESMLMKASAFRSERNGLERLPSTIDPHHCLRPMGSVESLPGDVGDTYELKELLGKGAFGIVSRVEQKGTRCIYAMKSIAITKVEDPELFQRELAIARRLKHPRIVKLHQCFRDADAYHLVMDLCTGGDLLERVRETLTGKSPGRPKGGLRSAEVARHLGQMLKGIAYLHNYQFAHRDIKPENYLLEDTTPTANLKLIDFGLARSFKDDKDKRGKRMTSRVGSVCYVAPEVVTSKNGYTENCDIWSAGVTVWVMALAARPYEGRSLNEYLQAVRRQQPMQLGEAWERHPEEIRRVVAAMLEMDPAKRPSAHELLRSGPWLRREACPGGQQECCCSLQ